jgi:predicted transposase YbfD/YdcC
MIKNIFSHFNKLTDKRERYRCIYAIGHLATLVLIGAIVGCTTWKGIHLYLSAPHITAWLMLHMPGLKGIPGVDTLARNMAALDPGELNAILLKLVPSFVRRAGTSRKVGRPRKDEMPPEINMDGKQIRGASPLGKTHLINVLFQITLMFQFKVFEKTNEIPMIPLVLEQVAKAGLLARRLVTMDAMGCQKAIVDKIRELHAWYLICLKGNQSGLLEQVRTIFEVGLNMHPGDFKAKTHATDWEKGHGRIERWEGTVVYLDAAAAAQWLTLAKDWAGLATVIMVTRYWQMTGEDELKSDTRYFICSLGHMKPKVLMNAVRRHWGIESFHWVLDTSFCEDACKIHRGNAPQAFSFMRKVAINLMWPVKIKHGKSFDDLKKMLLMNRHFLEALLELEVDEVDPDKWWSINPETYCPCNPPANWEGKRPVQ